MLCRAVRRQQSYVETGRQFRRDVMRMKLVKVIALVLLLSLLLSCRSKDGGAAEVPADVATSWFDLQLKLIKETPGFTPPVSSRALGYSGVTLYEAIVAGMPENNSLVGQLNELSALPQPEADAEYHWGAVANSALATILAALYPTATPENLAAIEALEQEYADQFRDEAGDETFERSVAHGEAVAQAVFEWSMTDGGHEGYTRNFPEDYVPPEGPGMWVTTPPNHQRALQPYWGDNRTFVLNTDEDCLPPPPPEYSEDPVTAFHVQAMEVYGAVRALTPEQEAIALFWADDPGATATPPGHSVSIATTVLRQEVADLATAAETYARVGIAVADAFVSCWDTKFTYNLIRPITYIQALIDADWNTPDITDPVITPPFPEYTSGHSSQSGAAAAVLAEMFGEDYEFTDDTHAARGLPARSFDSFDDFAQEAAISRLYGGIHYRAAIELGLEQGACIGGQVNGLAWKK